MRYYVGELDMQGPLFRELRIEYTHECRPIKGVPTADDINSALP